MTVLELRSDDLHIVSEELRAKVTASPGFFNGSAIVFSFEHIDNTDHWSLAPLVRLCSELGLVSTGIRGGSPRLVEEAHKLGLAAFPKGKAKNEGDEAAQEREHGETPLLNETASGDSSPSKMISAEPVKVIDTPVRSGQQVYSPGDMIVTASVSAGAELLAEGDIHVYGALRGRALAGVRGSETARIFCLSQEAELVSIAGHFLIDEVLRSAHWKTSVQITYDGNDVQVKKLSI